MKKNLFGNHIECSCDYCTHANASDKNCAKGKKIKATGKCRWFCYDPLKRVPYATPKLPDYDPDDFAI